MKKILLTVVILSAAIFGCTKQETSVPYYGVTGDWKYIGYAGGLAGFRFTPAPDTIKNYLQFDATRLLMNNGGIQSCTGYSFVKDSSAGYHGLLTFTDTTIYPREYDVTLRNDTLVLYPHLFADAFETYYARSLKTFTWCAGSVH